MEPCKCIIMQYIDTQIAPSRGAFDLYGIVGVVFKQGDLRCEQPFKDEMRTNTTYFSPLSKLHQVIYQVPQ